MILRHGWWSFLWKLWVTFETQCNDYSQLFIKRGVFQQFGEKAPGRNWEKMIDYTAKLGEINDIEDNKGIKI